MRNIYDQLSKLAFRALFRDIGEGQAEQEVVAEVQAIDFWFEGPEHPEALAELGLLGKLATKATVFEFYSQAPSLVEMRECITKHHVWYLQQRREAKGQKPVFPQMWLLCSGRPETVLERYRGEAAGLGVGVYRFASSGLEEGIVVLPELAEVPETRLLRLLGRGETQRRAARELFELPRDTWRREELLQILRLLRFELIQQPDERSQQEEEFFMTMQQTFREYEQELLDKGMERGRQQSLLRIYQTRFGPVSEELRHRIESTHELETLDRWIDLVVTASAEEIAQELLDEQACRQSARNAK